MSWRDQLRGNSLAWLLESENAGVRYLALRDVLELPAEDRELRRARKAAHQAGPIAAILSKMETAGYWVKAGHGYSPKYRATVWSMLLLAQLGASAAADKRIQQACSYLLDHTLMDGGQFIAIASGTPCGTIDCLQGNMCWALMALGFDDPRLEKAYEWMARTVTGDGMAPPGDRDAPLRYYQYKCGPNFACSVNGRLPCAWGAVKVLLAFAAWPVERRTALIKKAIRQGVDLMFSTDPATAEYPHARGDQPNRSWWKFGFPVFYVTDLLQVAEALAGLGHGRDRRLSGGVELIRGKQDGQGRWPLEYNYAGKSWVDFGARRQPNPWVTLRALKVLKAIG